MLFTQVRLRFYYNFSLRNNYFSGATKLDDPCIEDIQCTKPFGNHASCNITSRGYKACSCMTGAHFKGGRCYTTSSKYSHIINYTNKPKVIISKFSLSFPSVL